MLAKEAVGQRFVFAQQTEQQVLRFNIRRAELAGFISCKKDHAPCFFGVPFKHCISPGPSAPAITGDGKPSPGLASGCTGVPILREPQKNPNPDSARLALNANRNKKVSHPISTQHQTCPSNLASRTRSCL